MATDHKDNQDNLSVLSERLLEGRCVLFLGSGISASYRDPSGKVYKGLPMGNELLRQLQQSRSYVTLDMSLAEALTMKYIRERKAGLLEFIYQNIPLNFDTPLPAHHEIARLPLSAVITTNWDRLLEHAFGEANLQFHVIVEDSDVSIIRPESIPLVKLHGTLERPDTIVATYDDMLDLFARRPILASLMRVLCANATLLFVGFKLDDVDFRYLFRGLQRELGHFMPVSFSVQRDALPQAVDYWQTQGVTIMNADATDFLQELNISVLLRDRSATEEVTGLEDCLDDAIFRPLLGSLVTMSESQLIDEALHAALLVIDSSPKKPLRLTAKRVKNAIRALAGLRPRYNALSQLATDIAPTWFSQESTLEEARERICEVVRNRETALQKIGHIGVELIKPGDKILLYSQSTRVAEVLRQWLSTRPGGDVKFTVAECRPKSPRAFQGALPLLRDIVEGEGSAEVVPDEAIAYLMTHNGINKVFLGAHGGTRHPGGRLTVTNTTGSLMIALLARDCGIPVYVFTEEAKIMASERAGGDGKHESNLMADASLTKQAPYEFSRMLQIKQIQYYNPGYDELDSQEVPFILVTESGVQDPRAWEEEASARKTQCPSL
jgi:translation initiation factor 2B subunit (eIF-2B alpha/beta/delta family)